MKTIYAFISLFCLSSLTASEWLYYKHYPWVYDNKTEDWLYLLAGSDGQVYAYRKNTDTWAVFKVEEETPVQQEEETAIVPTDEMSWDEKYEIWIQNPEPYGGTEALNVIKNARHDSKTLLNLDNNNISDLTPLMGLTNLEILSLASNNISDLTPLAGLAELDGLYLNNNNISDLTPLMGLTNLEILSLVSNNISDLTPLSGLTELDGLYLDNNSISDLTPLMGLTNLTALNLSYNNISDLAPLAGLAELLALFLSENNISGSQKTMLVEALPSTYIDF